MNTTQALFDLANIFNVEDHMFVYGETLNDEVSDKQVATLINMLEISAPMKILDMACGFGRHSNRLAALGHQVTGFDLVPGFLDLARRAAKARGVQVDYQQGDMRSLGLDSVYDVVLSLFTAFGYFEDEGNLLVLNNVAHALKPGGLFMLDIQNRDVLLTYMLPYIVTEKEDGIIIDQCSFDSLYGLLHNQRILIRDGKRVDKPHTIRLYNPTEIRDLLKQAGLSIYKTYGGWDEQPLSSSSRRMIIIAQKPINNDQVHEPR